MGRITHNFVCLLLIFVLIMTCECSFVSKWVTPCNLLLLCLMVMNSWIFDLWPNKNFSRKKLSVVVDEALMVGRELSENFSLLNRPCEKNQKTAVIVVRLVVVLLFSFVCFGRRKKKKILVNEDDDFLACVV